MAAYRYGGITVRKIDQQDTIVGFGTSFKGACKSDIIFTKFLIVQVSILRRTMFR